jgi:predicted nucleic acid-binding protein
LIACDTSVLIDYLEQIDSPYTRRLEEALDQENLWLPPVVVTELYGAKTKEISRWNILTNEVPLLEIYDGYWDRAGSARRKLLLLKHKARLGDALIAQSCIDHDVPLLSRDADYKLYAKHHGLKLLAV